MRQKKPARNIACETDPRGTSNARCAASAMSPANRSNQPVHRGSGGDRHRSEGGPVRSASDRPHQILQEAVQSNPPASFAIFDAGCTSSKLGLGV
jgi:hypothetical protein